MSHQLTRQHFRNVNHEFCLLLYLLKPVILIYQIHITGHKIKLYVSLKLKKLHKVVCH